MSGNRLGAKHSEESKRKISLAKRGSVPWNKGLTKETSEIIRKQSEKTSGDNHYNWKNESWDYKRYRGMSKKKRQYIMARDNYECQHEDCYPEDYGIGLLVVHHIDGDRTNPSNDNLLTVCQSCNMRLV